MILPQLVDSSANAVTLIAPTPLMNVSMQSFIWSTAGNYAPDGARVGLKDAHVDPAEWAAVLDQWQDRLGVEAFRVPYWAAIAGGLEVHADRGPAFLVAGLVLIAVACVRFQRALRTEGLARATVRKHGRHASRRD